ncbi:uncharacterized protein LOC141855606 [Brevipalpus obovatus]|uniref:uncharacterized protein LOC141855606 n=1 Tax=Brevipalpus obovatus TaxID=246614 RepID=UPI003D9F065D
MISAKGIRSPSHIFIIVSIFLHFLSFGGKVVAIVLTGDDLNYACITYLKSNGQLNETLSQFRGHLSIRKFAPNILDQDSQAIEQAIRVIVNSPPDLPSVKATSTSVVANSPGPLFALTDTPDFCFHMLTPATFALLPFGGNYQTNAFVSLADSIASGDEEEKEEEEELDEEEEVENDFNDYQDDDSDLYGLTRGPQIAGEKLDVNRSLNEQLKTILRKIEPKMFCSQFSFPRYMNTNNFGHVNRLQSDINRQRRLILANYINEARKTEIN